jgi:translation initiation factor IF-3
MQQTTNNQTQYRVRINKYIRVPQVRVVLADGSSPGIVETRDALKMAVDQGLDLVEINPRSVPPVCKIMDYGKFKYEEKKKLAESKKNQKTQELKELTFRPNTDEGDLAHKLEQAKGFLIDGHKVKFTIKFRGREITHPQVGKDKLNWMITQLTGLISPSPQVNLEGKFMSMIVTPTKK